MKKFLFTLLLIPACALPARAACDDNISYAINKYGQCVDLTSLTMLGSLEHQIADLGRQQNPIVLRNPHVETPVEGIHKLKGEAFNQSRYSVYVYSLTVRITGQIDGNLKDLGVEKIYINQRIAPGASVAIDQILDSDRHGAISLAGIDAR